MNKSLPVTSSRILQKRIQDKKSLYISEQKLKRLSQFELSRKLLQIHSTPSPKDIIPADQPFMFPCSDLAYDLKECYWVPIPEGERCIVISGHGHTSAHFPSQNTFPRFKSMLPGGSYASL